MSSDLNHHATADSSHCAHLLSLEWFAMRPLAHSSIRYQFLCYSVAHDLVFGPSHDLNFDRFFVDFDWVTASVAVSILQTTIKYVQNYFFSQIVIFFLLFCLFAVFDVRACSPTNSCWIAFHWVPFIYSHSDVGLCVPILQCQTVSLCRPRCTEHEQKGNCDLFRARTPFTEIIITLQHQIIAYHITRKLLTHTHTHSFHRVQLPRRHNEIEFYICALNLILFFNFTR